MCYIFDRMKRGFLFTALLSLIFLFVFMLKTESQSPKLKNPVFGLLVKGLLAHDVQEISTHSLHEIKEEAIILDTRSKAEYDTSHIPGAIWVGYEEFDIRKVENIPLAAKIVAYCSIGYRSEEITRKLVDAGYTQTSNLYGGIFEWVNQGVPIQDSAGRTTDTLHVYKKMWGIWTSAKHKVH